MATPVPIVRCRLGGSGDEVPSSTLRYVPLAEFELWKHLMETRHRRSVQVEAISVWIPEEAAVWNSGFAAEELEPVLRVRIDLPGPHGVSVPMERYFPAETYPRAQEAWLGHLAATVGPKRVVATPGYVVPPGEPKTAPASRLSA